jgi:hypothetical protein
MHRHCRNGLISFVLSIAMIAISGSRSEAQTKLRYHFKAGEVLHYDLEQTTRTAASALIGSLIDLSSTLHLDLTWEVTNVAPDGKAKITVGMERIRYRLFNAAGASNEYDTNDDKVPADEVGQTVHALIKSLVGPVVELNMDGLGNITEFKIVERAKTSMSKIPRDTGWMLNEEGLKRLLVRAFVLLPDQAVAKGKPWQQVTELKRYSFDNRTNANKEYATIKTESTYTWEGNSEVGGKSLDRIAIKTKSSIQPDESFAKISIGDQSGDGSALFDAGAGQLVDNALKQQTNLAISVGSTSVDERIEQTTSLKLKSKSK